MSGMSDREKAFENKFAHDEELKFRAISRRNKLAGLWAADLIGRPDRDAYATEVVVADFAQAGHEDVFLKLRQDFDAAGIAVTDTEIRTKMLDLLTEASAQVENP